MRTLSFCFSTDAHLVKPTVDCMQSLYQLHLALGSRKGGCNKVSEAWDIWLGTNMRIGRVNSLPISAHIYLYIIYHVLCCKWFNRFNYFLCKQRSTDSTDHLIPAVPCCPEHRGYHLQRDAFAEWPPPVRTVIYCAALPPPNMNQISDEWNLGRLIGTYHFRFTTFEITTIEILRSLEAKNGKSNVFFWIAFQTKKTQLRHSHGLKHSKHHQTSSNIIKLYTCVE